MKTNQRITLGAVVAMFLLGLGGCAGMSNQDKNTAIGAGAGAVGGLYVVSCGTGAGFGGLRGR
nr:osmotically-inducible lipoprotein B [Accumulibacter sp.]